MAHCHSASNLTLGNILSLDIELLATNTSNGAVWKIERHLWSRVFTKIVIVLEFMKIFAGCDCIKTSVVSFKTSKSARFAF